MELNDKFKSAILLSMEDPTLSFEDTFVAAIQLYVATTGAPIQLEDEEEGIQFFRDCQMFILDEVLSHLVLEGLVEVSGMQDDEFVYQLKTEE